MSQLPLIIADSSDEQTLQAMAKQARVVVNVVGPYRLYGEAVVKAAVENGIIFFVVLLLLLVISACQLDLGYST